VELTNNSTKCYAFFGRHTVRVPSFGEALREKRRAAGLSQRELARRAGLDFSYISKVENGRHPPPSAETVIELCRILRTPPEEMLALVGKIPEEVEQALSKSAAAQGFLQQAGLMKLSDEEWQQMSSILRRLRGQ
jgi:transcriptional regulator with XRE-family HTH domain